MFLFLIYEFIRYLSMRNFKIRNSSFCKISPVTVTFSARSYPSRVRDTVTTSVGYELALGGSWICNIWSPKGFLGLSEQRWRVERGRRDGIGRVEGGYEGGMIEG